MPDNLCLRRRRLYEPQLAQTRKFFADLAQTADPKVAPALADPALVDALEEILNIYVVYGVERDLRRLGTGNVLFLKAAPPIDQVLARNGAQSPSTKDVAKRVAKATDAQKRAAYDRYFSWYIDPANVAAAGEDAKSGVAAFYERYPLLDHAVRSVTDHHQKNVALACKRIADNWRDIESAFFLNKAPGQAMERLIRIKTTGNDFHKGGRQVLILTFSLADGSTGRVVYKPSNVAIDCRIVGDSNVFAFVQPHVKGEEGYQQEKSLTELINDATSPRQLPGGLTSSPLPTYRILPYDRDSVPDAYGYIEFLTHDPPVPDSDTVDGITKAVAAVVASTRDPQRSDWIITDPAQAEVFYHQLGGLMAMATALSLSDLHVQNAIVHARQPHLIDLEEALKRPMAHISDTYMGGWLDAFRDPEGKGLKIAGDLTSDLKATWQEQVGRPAPCVLYLRHDTSPQAERMTLVGAAGAGNRTACLLGLEDVVEALADPATNAKVQKWAEDLGGTIARYVTFATVEYAMACRRLYQGYCENSIDQLGKADDDPAKPYASFSTTQATDDGSKVTYFFAGQVSDRRSFWNVRMANIRYQKAWDWPPAPFFAVEHPDHAWRDYLNCDVPSFYHHLDEPELLNSQGATVNVSAAALWQNKNMGKGATALSKAWKPNSNGTYLPGKPTEMICDQLDRLRDSCATDDGRREYVKALLEGMGELDSDYTALSKGSSGGGSAQ